MHRPPRLPCPRHNRPAPPSVSPACVAHLPVLEITGPRHRFLLLFELHASQHSESGCISTGPAPIELHWYLCQKIIEHIFGSILEGLFFLYWLILCQCYIVLVTVVLLSILISNSVKSSNFVFCFLFLNCFIYSDP